MHSWRSHRCLSAAAQRFAHGATEAMTCQGQKIPETIHTQTHHLAKRSNTLQKSILQESFTWNFFAKWAWPHNSENQMVLHELRQSRQNFTYQKSFSGNFFDKWKWDFVFTTQTLAVHNSKGRLCKNQHQHLTAPICKKNIFAKWTWQKALF